MGNTLELKNLTENEKNITLALLVFRLSERVSIDWLKNMAGRLENIWPKMKKSVEESFLKNLLTQDLEKWVIELEEKYGE